MMAYDIQLADRVRAFLSEVPNIDIEEKEMFGVLNFLVNGKTCVCVRTDHLMLRFNPALQEEISESIGYEPMYLKGKIYKGYCYMHSEGFRTQREFASLIQLCLDYNTIVKQTKRKK